MNRFNYSIYRCWHLLKNAIFYKLFFNNINLRTIINSPLKIDNPSNIRLGKCYIGYKTWLAAEPLTGEPLTLLEIHDGCRIGNFNHIYATGHIVIESSVLTADNVYISDNIHAYEDLEQPILEQPIVQKGSTIVIGCGSWIGEHACVIGANIGRNCVVGANSVVTKDIPDYCVAVGAPAIIIKRYNFEKKKWMKTDRHGDFL